MHIRPFDPADLDALLALTIETFRPSFEETFPALVGHDPILVAHQHGDWENDYRRQLPILHNPAEHRYVAVAEQDARIASAATSPGRPVGGNRNNATRRSPCSPSRPTPEAKASAPR